MMSNSKHKQWLRLMGLFETRHIMYDHTFDPDQLEDIAGWNYSYSSDYIDA